MNGQTGTAQSTVWRAANADAAGQTMVVLLVGNETTQVQAGAGLQPEVLVTLPVGALRCGETGFRHDPPTPHEMELAIMAVEDHVMPLARQLPPGGTLYTADAAIRHIAHAAGLTDAPRLVLPLLDVERVYNLLVDVALGRPASISGVRTDPPFAATLTLLREFMHHLGFASVVILPTTDQPA